MKMRNGFVSNSSSSSFIIGLKNKPNSVEETAKILLHPSEKLSDEIEDGITYKTICKRIYDDLINTKPSNDEDVLYKLGSAAEVISFADNFCSLSLTRHTELTEEQRNQIWDTHNKLIDEKASEILERLKRKHYDKKIYILEYEDDTTIGRIIEHGDILDRLNPYKISEH